MNVQQAYSSVAGLYIDLFGSPEKVPADDLALVARHLGNRKGPVLDLGCGPGHLTAYLRSLGADARGIDLVPEFIAHARATHPEVDYRVRSLLELDVADGSISGILAYYSLIHFPPSELDDVLASFRRVLVPDGVFVLGMFDGEKVEPFDHKVVTAYRWPPDELSKRLADAGFTEVERVGHAGDGTHRPLCAMAARAVA